MDKNKKTQLLDLYILDYMKKKGFKTAADTFVQEAHVSEKEPAVKDGLLTDWWALLWDQYKSKLETDSPQGVDNGLPYFPSSNPKRQMPMNQQLALALRDHPQYIDLDPETSNQGNNIYLSNLQTQMPMNQQFTLAAGNRNISAAVHHSPYLNMAQHIINQGNNVSTSNPKRTYQQSAVPQNLTHQILNQFANRGQNNFEALYSLLGNYPQQEVNAPSIMMPRGVDPMPNFLGKFTSHQRNEVNVNLRGVPLPKFTSHERHEVNSPSIMMPRGVVPLPNFLDRFTSHERHEFNSPSMMMPRGPLPNFLDTFASHERQGNNGIFSNLQTQKPAGSSYTSPAVYYPPNFEEDQLNIDQMATSKAPGEVLRVDIRDQPRQRRKSNKAGNVTKGHKPDCPRRK